MSKPSPGAMRAAEKIWVEFPELEAIAYIIDEETGILEFVQLAYAIQQGRRLHDYCNPCPTCGEKADRLIAKAEGREGT